MTAVIDTSRSPRARLRPVPIRSVRLTDRFWEPRRRLNRTVSLREQHAQLEETAHHQRFMLSLIRLVEELEDEIAGLDQEVDTRMRPCPGGSALLDEIPGIGSLTAEAVLAETGLDMGRFPTAAQFASWGQALSRQEGERRQAPLRLHCFR